MIASSKKMSVSLLVFAFLCWSLSEPVMAGTRAGGKKPSKYAPGELLVKYRDSLRASGSESYRGQWKGATIRKFRHVGIDRVRVSDGMTVEEALEDCRKDPEVEYAEPNYYRRAEFVEPDDADFPLLWGLEKIQAPEAWGDPGDPHAGSHAVVVAVLDSGADLDHPDLVNNLVAGWDFVGDDDSPDDDNGHGTHVCGTIGAEGNNGIGVVGVNWAVSIMPLKILDTNGDGLVSDEIAAIDYAIDYAISHDHDTKMIINASYSGASFSSSEYALIEDARDAGILFVAASGNGGSDNEDVPAYPASYDLDNIIAVAATDQSDKLASFSDYGATVVDVAAPGVRIYSTKPGDSYQYLGGTSMAAPHVAGLAALIWAGDWEEDGDFDYRYSQVEARILNGVDVFAGLSGKMLMGGRINAYHSLISVDPAQKPDAPSLVSADVVSSDAVRLTWTDNASTESGFKVVRAFASGGSYDHVGTAAANAGSFTDTTARDGTTQYYAVMAFNMHGDSDLSDALAATTPLAAPTGLTAQAISSTRIDLRWTDNSTVEVGYSIEEEAGSGGGFAPIATVGPNVQTYSRTGLDPSTTHTYRVRAYKGSAFSGYSNTASALPSVASGASSVSVAGGSGGGGGCFVGTVVGEGFLGL
jgi:subtilisin family serine protease